MKHKFVIKVQIALIKVFFLKMILVFFL